MQLHLTVETESSNNCFQWNFVQLLRNDLPAGSHREWDVVFGGTSKAVRTLGSASETWGCSGNCFSVSSWKNSKSGIAVQTEGRCTNNLWNRIYNVEQRIFFFAQIGVSNVVPEVGS